MMVLLAGVLVASLSAPAGAQSAPSQWQNVHGKVEKVEETTLTFKADDGRTLTVDMSQVGENVRKTLTPGEGATVVGFPGAQPNQFMARFIQQDSSDPSRGGRVVGQPSAPAGSWQNVHGKVEKVEGTTLTFKADDGRTLTVDLSQVGENVRKALTPGGGATVVGFPGAQPNQFTARFIQQDSSDPSRGGRVQPSASPPSEPKK
jgi:preprotein translocase subunit YajC